MSFLETIVNLNSFCQASNAWVVKINYAVTCGEVWADLLGYNALSFEMSSVFPQWLSASCF